MLVKKYLKDCFCANHLKRSDSLLEMVVPGTCDEILLSSRKSALELCSPFEGGALISTVSKGIAHLFQKTMSEID